VAESSTSAWRQLRDLIAESASAQTKWAETVLAATRAAARGERVNSRDLVQTVGSEYAEYVRELTRINLEYAKALRELTTETSGRLSKAMDKAAGRAAADAQTVARAPAGTSSPARKTAKSAARKRSASKKSASRKRASKRTATKKSAATSSS
jgi:hypothetical protein